MTRLGFLALISWGIALGATVATATGLVAQQRPDPLAPLVAAAWRANLGLAGERLAARRAAAQVREARGLFFPALTLESRHSRLSGVPNIGDFVNPAYAALNQVTGTSRFPTDINLTLPQRHDSHLELVQPLFNEAIRANYAVAEGRYDGQRLALRAAARRLAADVQLAYLGAASAQRAVAIYEASLALGQENERVAERLLQAGRALPEAVFRARADRSEIEQQLAEARQRAAAAVRVLNQLLRRPLDTAIDFVADSAFAAPLGIDVERAVAHAEGQREELAQLDAGIRTAQAGVRAATAAFLPNLSLDLQYGYQSPDLSFGRNYSAVSLVVSWNLFNGGRDAARRTGAALEVDRTRTERADAADRIALEVRTAYDAAAVARAAIATATDRLEAARRTFELVRRRYEEGVASPIELVDARTALTAAELNRTVTGYQYAMHYVDLERAAALRPIDLSEDPS
jgi:outer membrane protein TolC